MVIMKTTFKVVEYEVCLDVLIYITLDNGDNLMTHNSFVDDVILGDYEIEVSNKNNTYLMTRDNEEIKTQLKNLLFIKL